LGRRFSISHFQAESIIYAAIIRGSVTSVICPLGYKEGTF
jgi:hypothetical protein